MVNGTVPASWFSPVAKKPSAGYTSSAVWLKVTLDRNGSWPKDMTAVLQPIYLHNLDIYVPRTANPHSSDDFTVFHRGTHNMRQQPGHWHMFYTVPLTLPDADHVTLYFRIRSGSSVMLRGSIATTAGLLDYTIRWMAFSDGLVVLSAIALLISLFLWTQSKRRFFLSFSLLMLSHSFLVACHTGFLPQTDGQTTDLLFSIASLLLNLANLLFVYDQIFPRHAPAWLRYPFFGAIAYNLAGFANLGLGIVPYSDIITPLVLATMAAIIIWLGYSVKVFLRERRAGGLTALIAAGIQTVFVVSSTSSLLGGPDLLQLGERDYWVTMAPFTFFMALSMIIRGNHLVERRKVGASQRLARRAERRAVVLARERTDALHQAMKSAEHALAKERDIRCEQTRFVDIIRHQYQTPLAVIRNSTATLLRTLAPDQVDDLERLRRIKAATADLKEVLEVSLKRSRIEGTGAETNGEVVHLQDFLTLAISRCGARYREHEIALHLEGSCKGREICLDTRMVALALDNLVSNAAKFSPAGSRIDVSAAFRENALFIDVRDQGIGIPETELASVTDRYFRASNTGNVNGMGLGLHIIAEIARAHGGEFGITNNDQGGVTAALTLRPAI